MTAIMPPTENPTPEKDSDVTVVITSCGRQDLLDATLQSFLQFNSYPIREYLITEDSGTPGINDALKRKYSELPIVWIEEARRGQLPCIDDAYSRVRTKYIFHCEDDWEFYASGFIERSRLILENCPGVLQVWLRAEYDTSGHPLDSDRHVIVHGAEPLTFRRLSYNFLGGRGPWHGFSFNPGLRRLADYTLIGNYAQYQTETKVSAAYKARLMSAVVMCGDGYVRHLGEGRHIIDKATGR